MSAVALGVGRGSKMVSNAADWLLRDEFISDLAAGSVNGTAAEPGPGTREVVDTTNKLSIASGQCNLLLKSAWGNPAILYSSLGTLVAGRTLIVSASFDATSSESYFGLNSSWTSGFLTGSGGYLRGWSPHLLTLPIANSTVYSLAIIACSTGTVSFIKGGVYTAWRMVWRRYVALDSTALSPYVDVASTNVRLKSIGVPTNLWLPTPLASDGFGSAFGTTDGLGHAEGIAGGIGAGGSGGTWGNAGGTWSVSGGKAINTAPSGLSQQISVAEMSTADVFASAALTRAAGSVGLALSVDNASSPANGVLVYLDGTNCKVDKIIGGITSNVSTTAVTYSAGARLVVAKAGTEYRVYYNNALVGAANTISDASIVSNTLHGLFSTDASNTLDDYTCYATGTGGEYAELDKWS